MGESATLHRNLYIRYMSMAEVLQRKIEHLKHCIASFLHVHSRIRFVQYPGTRDWIHKAVIFSPGRLFRTLEFQVFILNINLPLITFRDISF